MRSFVVLLLSYVCVCDLFLFHRSIACVSVRGKYGILCIFSPVCEYVNLEYVRVPVIYRVKQADYVIHILVAASQECVNL